jgi:hypothetical protein
LNSSALNINDCGAIVGEVQVSEPDNRRYATLWLNGRPLLLETLIRADDPLQPYVRLETRARSMIAEKSSRSVWTRAHRSGGVTTCYDSM